MQRRVEGWSNGRRNEIWVRVERMDEPNEYLDIKWSGITGRDWKSCPGRGVQRCVVFVLC